MRKSPGGPSQVSRTPSAVGSALTLPGCGGGGTIWRLMKSDQADVLPLAAITRAPIVTSLPTQSAAGISYLARSLTTETSEADFAWAAQSSARKGLTAVPIRRSRWRVPLIG